MRYTQRFTGVYSQDIGMEGRTYPDRTFLRGWISAVDFYKADLFTVSGTEHY